MDGDGNGFYRRRSGQRHESIGWDTVRNSANEPPTIDRTGRFDWSIQWKYRIKGTSGLGTPFFPVTQWMEIVSAVAGQPNRNGFTGKGGKGNVTVLP